MGSSESNNMVCRFIYYYGPGNVTNFNSQNASGILMHGFKLATPGKPIKNILLISRDMANDIPYLFD